MRQLIITFIAFLFIPLLLHFRIKLSTTITATAIMLGILSGITPSTAVHVVINVFVAPLSRDTVFTIMLVSLIGGAMKHYGLLDILVDSLLQLINSKKAVLMIVPSLIGTLIIPGGAILSAPFVDEIGESAGLPSPQRAAINLIFRHIAMLVFPFSMAILFIRSAIPDINIYIIILYNIIFLSVLLPIAYFLYLYKADTHDTRDPVQKKPLQYHLSRLAYYTAPIYVPVLINAATGMPFYISMIASLMIVYYQSDRVDFLSVLKKSASWDTVLIVTAILVIKNIIMEMHMMLQLFDSFFTGSTGNLSLLAMFMVTSVFFGLMTGNITAPLAVTLPILSRIPLAANIVHIYVYFLLISAFLGYYFSPLHLCQTFTIRVMKVSTIDLYKEYSLYVLSSFGLLLLTTASFLFLA